MSRNIRYGFTRVPINTVIIVLLKLLDVNLHTVSQFLFFRHYELPLKSLKRGANAPLELNGVAIFERRNLVIAIIELLQDLNRVLAQQRG